MKAIAPYDPKRHDPQRRPVTTPDFSALAPAVRARHDPALGPRLGQEPDVPVERLVGRPARQVVEGAIDMRAESRRQDRRELLECRREIRVVLVGVADHQPCRQDDGHRLAPGQLQRRQERVGLDSPTPGLRPERHVELALDRAQVAVDGADGRVDAAGDLRGLHAIRVGVEQGEDPGHPGQPVALARAALVVHGSHHRPLGVATSRQWRRSIAADRRASRAPAP